METIYYENTISRLNGQLRNVEGELTEILGEIISTKEVLQDLEKLQEEKVKYIGDLKTDIAFFENMQDD